MNLTVERERIECACTNLKIAGRFAGRAWDEALAPAGINHTQYAILANIARHQAIPKMDLASMLGLQRTTLYRAVAILERQGLLTKESVGHGKAQMLRMTPSGFETLEAARAAWQQVQVLFVGKLGAGRWKRFLEDLRQVQTLMSELPN